ncbi:hypothetical protein Golob_013128 [Gossypium lobatum]|uniref:Uncharacterized protein n=1 Tax=Gossypium lobatum TaxID=34289 RepID=A0A7J8LNL9_9ROSI|nr:hypothetical protein [Gossypium lobatum]
MGPSSAPMQEMTPVVVPPMATPPTGQYVPSYFGAYTNPFISIQALYIPPHFPTSTSMLGGLSFKPPIPRSKDTRWQPMQSTEGEEDERSKLETQSEVQQIRNPAHNRQPPRCGTDSNQYLD